MEVIGNIKHRHHRQLFQEAAQSRKASEESERQQRLRTGLAGIWDRVTGKRKRTLKQNAIQHRNPPQSIYELKGDRLGKMLECSDLGFET